MASRTRISSRKQLSRTKIGGRSRAAGNATSAKRSANPPLEAGRGRRTAYVPLKHSSETITERWSRTGRKDAPSAMQEQQQAATASPRKPTVAVSPTATRAALYKIAKRLAIKGRSAMTKRQLFEAISAPTSARVRVRSR
jgi:hypothetical protein